MPRCDGGVARTARQPALRLRRPLAAAGRPQLLHDRLGRSREQRRRRRSRCGRPIRRCCTTARARSTSHGRRQVPGSDGVPDILLGVTAASDEPIAGGRHKVFGHHELAIIPQTSTIASHLPRAVGVAFAIDRAAKLGVDCAWPARCRRRVQLRRRLDQPRDRAVGAQHRRARRAPAARRAAVLRLRGQRPRDQRADAGRLGRRSARARRQLRYEHAAGGRPAARSRRPASSRHGCAATGGPRCSISAPCGLGHAGADVESPIARPRRSAPIGSATRCSRTARLARRRPEGRTRRRSRARTMTTRARVREVARDAAGARNSSAPRTSCARSRHARPRPRSPQRRRRAIRRGADGRGPLTLAQAINAALADVLDTHPSSGLRRGRGGEGRRLRRDPWPACAFGAGRVFDTLLDETVDSRAGARARRSPASCRSPRSSTSPTCTTPRTSCAARRRRCSSSPGQYRNGMVVRIAGYGYQKGFGGHFHNDDAVGVLRDIPGLVIASPARPGRCGRDAADVRRRREGRRQRLRVPRADRALPHP